MNPETFLQNSKAVSPVIGALILFVAGVAASLGAVFWVRSVTYSYMRYEELEITSLHLYQGTTSPFPDLPEEHVSGSGQNVTFDEPSDILITGSANNVTVIGKPFNIRYVGGNNNLTLISSGVILIDTTNPDVTLTQVPGGWLLQAILPNGRPIIRGDIYLNSEGSKSKKVYIIGGKIIFCDNSYSAVAATVMNTGTHNVEISGVHLNWEPVTVTPIPCVIHVNNQASLSISCTWVAGEIYRISIMTSRGNTFHFAVVGE